MILGRLTLRSPAPPDEVRRRVERLLGPQEVAPIGGLARRRMRAFRGEAREASFTLRRVLSSGRASFVRVRGELAPERDGTRIRVRLGLAGWRPIVAAALLGLHAAAVVAAIADAVRGHVMPGEQVALVVAFPMALAFVLLFVGAERERVRRLLGYLTGELTSRGLAHELAEARE